MRSDATHSLILVLPVLVAACGGRDPAGAQSDEGTAEASTTTTGGADEGVSRLDVAGGEGGATGASAEGGPGAGCDKLDFLFVIDNSSSMADEQQHLAASFPGLMTAIEDTLDVHDFHVMAVDTDAVSPFCLEFCAMSPGSLCKDVACSTFPDPATCDGTLGAGRAIDRNGDPCPIADDRRYLVDGQPDLGATFSCLALAGTAGDVDERQVQAALDALAPPLSDPGGCNEGFSRKDAVLVVTFVTDEDDNVTSGEPAQWVMDLTARKAGDARAVVPLGLIGDTGLPDPLCEPYTEGGDGAADAWRLREMISTFPLGRFSSICADDFGPFFAESVAAVQQACASFVPPP